MTPAQYLTLLLALTLGAAALYRLRDGQRRRQLQRLARQLGMHYSRRDRFRLADRVAASLPVPGAADVALADMIYGIRGDEYRYIFTAHFTAGVAHGQQRSSCVVAYSEPRDRATRQMQIPLKLAPEDLSPLDQYRHLVERQREAREDET